MNLWVHLTLMKRLFDFSAIFLNNFETSCSGCEWVKGSPLSANFPNPHVKADVLKMFY